MNQTIQLVVIADEANGIGKDNQLLAKMPEDLKHFKRLTTGFPVLMGRKTFDSVGNRPLPNRRNIIITRQDIDFEGCETVHSIEEGIALCQNQEKISIVGGDAIFRQCMGLANVIELTRLHHTFQADTFFPEISLEEWEQTNAEPHQPDDKNPYPYTFITYKRK